MTKEKRILGNLCEGRNNNFDFIRFLAASLVIYSHAFPLSAGNSGEILKDLTNERWSFGSLSVAVFFIISGFLISQSYDRSKNVIKFIKARLLRIFPGLICVIVLSAFVLGPLVTELPLTTYFKSSETYEYLKSIFLFPLYWNLPGVFEYNFYSPSVNGSLWTIPFEFFFYGVVLVLGVAQLLQRKKVNLFLFLTFTILEIYKYELFPVEGHIFSLPRYSFIELSLFFSAGMLLYSMREYVILDKHIAMFSIIALSVFVLNGIYDVPFAIFGSYLIMYFSFSEKIKLSGFSKYGDFSYGIYIYGFPVQQTVVYLFGGTMNPYLNTLISYPIVLVLSVLSWYLVEKPCIQLKKKQILHLNLHENELLARMSESYKIALNKLSMFGWKTFAVICVGILVYVNAFLAVPNTIKFPYENDSIFLNGWLPQSTSEDYRWVQQESSIEINVPKNASKFYVLGYVPENFSEVNHVQIYINDVFLVESDLTAGGALGIEQDIKDIGLPNNETVIVKIVFNAQHIPDENEVDQRVMSALISSIGFE